MLSETVCHKITFFMVSLTVSCLVGYSLGGAADERNTTRMSGNVDPKIVECLATGQQALEKGDLESAQKALSGCVSLDPKFGPARYWLGMVYFLKHDAAKATGEFKEVLRLEPENYLAMGMLGKLYSFDQSKLSLAQELLEKAISVAPDNDDARFDLGRVYAQQGQLDKAMKEFETIFQSEIRFALYHTEFAKILSAAGRKAEAKKHLDRAIAVAPDFEPAKQALKELQSGPGSAGSN